MKLDGKSGFFDFLLEIPPLKPKISCDGSAVPVSGKVVVNDFPKFCQIVLEMFKKSHYWKASFFGNWNLKKNKKHFCILVKPDTAVGTECPW